MRVRQSMVALLIAAQMLCAGCALPPVAGAAGAPGMPGAPGAPGTPAAGTPGTTGGTTTSTTQSGNTIVAVSSPTQPCCPKQNLLDFLGITCLFNKLERIGGCLLSLLGNTFPWMEPGPALDSLASGLNSTNPAVASAANAKQQEDQAPQKIKAIKYLATLGCTGCYPGIEEALLASLDDCTESVRYNAALALYETARTPCVVCNTVRCCSPKVRKRLRKVIENKNDKDCYVESSPRVRRFARLALEECGEDCSALCEETPELPQEGPSVPVEGAPAPAPAGAIKQASAEFPAPLSTSTTRQHVEFLSAPAPCPCRAGHADAPQSSVTVVSQVPVTEAGPNLGTLTPAGGFETTAGTTAGAMMPGAVNSTMAGTAPAGSPPQMAAWGHPPYGAPPQPYAPPGYAPQAYGAPGSPYAPPQPYGAPPAYAPPQPYGAPPAYAPPQPYGAPPQQYAPPAGYAPQYAPPGAIAQQAYFAPQYPPAAEGSNYGTSSPPSPVAPQYVPSAGAPQQSPLLSNAGESSRSTPVVIARVNGEPISQAEIASAVDAQLAKVGPISDPARAQETRTWLIRQQLQLAIERKLLCQQARRQLSPEELAGLVTHEQRSAARIGKRVPGTEELVADAWLQRTVQVQADVSAAEIEEYYRTHTAQYQQPAAVRWERVSVPFANCSGRQQAEETINYLRDRALGKTTAKPGDLRLDLIQAETFGWTRRDEISSESTVCMVFVLPVGGTSPVLEDEQGLSIVRVLEHRAARTMPVAEAGPQIREQLQRQKRRKSEQAYVQQLLAGAQVWNALDQYAGPTELPR